MNSTRSSKVSREETSSGYVSGSATLVLAEVEAAVQLVLVVSSVGLAGDRRGAAVGQRTPHLLVLGLLLHGSIHAVELWSAWRGTAGGSREQGNK